MATLDGAENDKKITVLTQITQLFPHMRELLIIVTRNIDNSLIFRVYPKQGIFIPHFRQEKSPFLCMHEGNTIINSEPTTKWLKLSNHFYQYEGDKIICNYYFIEL